MRMDDQARADSDDKPDSGADGIGGTLKPTAVLPKLPLLRASVSASTVRADKLIAIRPRTAARQQTTEQFPPVRVLSSALANAERLATITSRRELQRTVRALCAAEPVGLPPPSLPSDAPPAASTNQPAGAPRAQAIPGQLTRFWHRLSEGNDPRAILAQAALVPLLKQLDAELLRSAVVSDHVKIATLGRDEQLSPLAGTIFIISGQLGLSLFSTETLEDEARFRDFCQSKSYEGAELAFQRGLRQGPLARAALANLLTLESGDVIGASQALHRFYAKLPDTSQPILYAITPATVCVIEDSVVEDWGHLDARFREGLEAQLLRCLQATNRTSVPADSYIREGLSIAQTLRVIDADRCVSCRDCERACAERHGQARLTVRGPTVGRLILPDTCRTCIEPRCMAACGFDALSYDAALGEVTIHEDKCVGCSYCETACPYGAISMVDLSAAPAFVEKMAERSARARLVVNANDRHPLVDRRLRVANKCDHCAGYADQACISACQHEAIFEVRPQPLFLRMSKADQALSTSTTVKPAPRDAAELKSADLTPLAPLASRLPAPASRWPAQPMLIGMLLLAAGLYVSALLSIRHLSHSSGYGLAGGVLGWALLLFSWAFPISTLRPQLREAAVRPGAPSHLARILTSLDLHAASGWSGFLLVLLHARFLPSGRNPLALLAFLFLVLTGASGGVLLVLPRWLTRGIAATQVLYERLHSLVFEDSQLGSELRRAALAVIHEDAERIRRAMNRAEEKYSFLHQARAVPLLLGSVGVLFRSQRSLIASARQAVLPPGLVGNLRSLLIARRLQLLLPALLGMTRPARYIHLASAVLLLCLAVIHVGMVMMRW